MVQRRVGDFELLWAGQTVSYLGNEITRLALPVLAIEALNATTADVGILRSLVYLPFLLLGLPAGVWASGWDRRRVLIMSDLGRATAVLALIVVVQLGAASMGAIWGAGLAVGVFAVFFEVAFAAYPPSLVPRAQLMGANARLEASGSLARLVGPAIGGGIVAGIGVVGALLADALTFLVSVASIVGIRNREPLQTDAPPRSFDSLGAGLRFVAGDRVLRPLLVCAAIYAMFDAATLAVLPLVILRDMGQSPLELGIVLGFGGVGLVAGNALASRVAQRTRTQTMMRIGAFIAVAGHVFLAVGAVLQSLPVMAAAVLIGGWGDGTFAIPYVTLRQIAPAPLLTRVVAIFRTSVWGAIPLGGLFVAAAGALPPTVILNLAACLISICLVPLMARGLSDADRRLAGK